MHMSRDHLFLIICIVSFIVPCCSYLAKTLYTLYSCNVDAKQLVIDFYVFPSSFHKMALINKA